MSTKMRSPITTHILDISLGKPAGNVLVDLEVKSEHGWTLLNQKRTNGDGRVEDLLPPGSQAAVGVYRLSFHIEDYFQTESFYPSSSITFRVQNPQEHYHVPLLLSPFGFSTYRGS